MLLSYIWADEYWVAAYNIADYRAAAQGEANSSNEAVAQLRQQGYFPTSAVEEARGLPRIARFHFPSVLLGAALIAAAAAYKKFVSASPDGFPWYFTYLTLASTVPSAGFFRAALPFINWRAFSFIFFLLLLISLLWEVTLAIPYGWWGYRPGTMLGLFIGAWTGLPVEAVCVWFAVTYTTVITYEVIKLWKALGTGALEAFFGIRK